jgi:hypothetical protein
MGKIAAPQPLSGKKVIKGFECRNGFLNDWLKRCLENSRVNASKTFVVCVNKMMF